MSRTDLFRHGAAAKRRRPKVRKRPISRDEVEYRLSAAAAVAALFVLVTLVAALVSQLP